MTVPEATGARELAVIRAALEGEYEVLQELGRGGMAVVYRAREKALEREVAIKVLPFTLAMDEGVVQRFQREARTSAQLEHPHIVPIYRVGHAGQVTYFVMQFLRGQTLGDRLLEEGSLPVPEVRRLLREVGSALGYAAKQGVVHRDVKPDNIMIDANGRAIVTDFGIARSAAESRLTATGLSVGTPRYMSPEQARAKAMDGRSDLYSLGIVAYEALTGARPFDGDDPFAILMAHINTPPPVPTLVTEEERSVYAIIERLIAKDPDERFQTADEMMSALEGGSVLSGAPASRASAVRARALLSPTAPAQPTVGSADLSERGRDPLVSPALRELGQRTTMKALAGSRLGWQWALSRGPRFWAAASGLVALLVAGYWTSHFAIAHRSRCPKVERDTALATPAVTADSAPSSASSQPATKGMTKGVTKSVTKAVAKAPATAARSWSVLVDPLEPAVTGGEIDLYYDVCGLPADGKFSSTVAITRNQSAVRRLFGGTGVEPISREYEMEGGSPAERRHRDIGLGSLPAGGYTVRVSIADDKGRTRARSVPLEIIAR